MKYIVTIIIALAVSCSVFSQANNDENLKKTGPFLRFNPTEVNMGSIDVDKVTEETGKVNIEVFNDGSTPLILNQVTACCGTNVKDWPRQPIAPGQKGTIEVFFRVSPNPQRISRTVTVQSNAGNGAVQKVAILGEVVVPKSGTEVRLPR